MWHLWRLWRVVVQVVLCCLVFSFVAGCYTTPVRHLAADAAQIRVAVSTQKDVLAILGQPDRQVQQDGASVWMYEENKRGLVEDLPLLGDEFGSAERIRLLVRFQGDIATKVEYSAVDPDDVRWGQQFRGEE